MIVLKSLLAHLARPDVSEVVLQSGRRPAARVDGALDELPERPVSADDLVQILFTAGGSRYVESLGTKPTQWRTRVEGVGAVVVTATQRGDVIEAHFMTRDTAQTGPAQPAARPKARASSIPPGRGPKSGRASRGDGPPSKRKRHAHHADHAVETPRVLDPARFDASAATAPRSDELDVDTPPPAAMPAPHVPRDQMATLPSEAEIDLDLQASEIPSVPQPFLDDMMSGPHSPRTLPEAAFVREDDPPPPPARRLSHQMLRALTPPPGPSPVVDSPSDKRPEATRPVTPVGELTEPFAFSSRTPSLPAPDRRFGRTASGRTTRPFARDPHTPELRRLLRAARESGASDLHIVAGRPPAVRIAGQVVPRGEALDPQVVEDMMLSRVPSRLAATLDRDGSCDFAIEEPELGRFRVNVSRQRTGLKATMRLIAAEIPTLADLGLPDAIASATRHHQGLIVLTGPTGHGKTTTLAAVVDILNRETTRHIITVEDPIEYVHPRKMAMMSQREVGTHTRSFQTALKASLREDPDVIVVGELRDTETVRMAIAASETGHLVIGTMNTPSAAKTIDRLIDLFPPADQQQVRITLAGGLRLIVSQRLLPDVNGQRMLAAAEVLPGMVPLWNLIRDGRTYQIPSLQQRGKGLGVIRLDDSLADLARAGRVTAAAAVAVAEAPEELELVLGVRRPSQTLATPDVRARALSPAPMKAPDARPSEPQAKGGFLERAGALFGGKKGT
jgi:twitching motility protein PilT